MSKEKLTMIRQSMRNDKESVLFKALEKYNEKKVREIVSDFDGLLKAGYTESEIEKFTKFIKDRAYPVGGASYEVASRLTLWGFQNEAFQYYAQVANDNQNQKRKNAINQIVGYAVQLKKYDVFEKYYAKLEPKRKQYDLYLRFRNECQYYKGEYEGLYKMYLEDPSTTQLVLIYGSLKITKVQDTRIELIEKACEIGNFDYEFWMEYLSEILENDLEEYRSILSKLLNEYTIKSTWKIEEVSKLIQMDPKYAGEITEDMIRSALTEVDALVIAMVLCLKSDQISLEYKEAVIDNIVNKLGDYIDEMEYKKAYEIGHFLKRYSVDNDVLEQIICISTRGMDMYNMLPSGQDNYAKGKRFLILGADLDRACSYFIEEIETSDDKKKIALCGRELLASLLEAERYQEVIEWGNILIIDKEILEYSALALDVNYAFDKLMDERKKEAFVEKLVQDANQSIEEYEYNKALQKINIIEVFEKNHPLVGKFKNILEKTKFENINFDNESMIGRANIIRFIEHDEEKYISYVREAFKNKAVEKENRSTLATGLLDMMMKSGRVEDNIEFIDNIRLYEFTLTEHIIELLYSIVLEYRGVEGTIEYFSQFIEGPELEEKRLPVLIRLERLYKIALQKDVSFDVTKALEHMREYLKRNTSLIVQLSYIWILAFAGDIEGAGELLALVPDDIDLDEEQQEVLDKILEQYFSGKKPELVDVFANLVKEKTLYRLMEYCKDKSEFVTFSHEENKVYIELIKNVSNKMDVKTLVVKNAVIKTLYKETLNFKYWYLYFLGIKFGKDYELQYCVNVIMEIINTDQENSYAKKQANIIMNMHPEVEQKYKQYKIYNTLFQLYLQSKKFSQDNKRMTNIVIQIFKDKNSTARNLQDQTVAMDYIHLMKLLDDGDNYIYLKAAVFIAIDHGCEQYLYELFRRELLYREPTISIRMCIELVCLNRKNYKHRSFVNKFLIELGQVSKEHDKIIAVLLDEEKCFFEIGCVIQSYPEEPKEDVLLELVKNKELSQQEIIRRLEIIDSCYTEFLQVKKALVYMYRNTGESSYYEKMYQCLLTIIKNVETEWILYENCRTAMLLATAVDKKNLMNDIINMYKQISIGQENYVKIVEFSEACYSIDCTNDKQTQDLLDALIQEKWTKFFEQYHTCFVADTESMKVLFDYGKMEYILQGFVCMNILKGENREDEFEECKKAVNQLSINAFGEPISVVIDEIYALPIRHQQEFTRIINFKKKLSIFRKLPENKVVLKNLVRVWHIIYGEEVVIDTFVSNYYYSDQYKYLCRCVIEQYQDKQLIDKYITILYNHKNYDEIIQFNREFDKMEKSIKAIAYYVVSLLRQDEKQGLAVISGLQGEEYINVIILLKAEQLYSEKDLIYKIDPVKSNITELILSIKPSSGTDILKKIENQHIVEVKMGLLKLFYCTVHNEKVKRELYKKYATLVSENEYIVQNNNIIENETNNEFYVENMLDPLYPQVAERYDYVQELLAEISLEEYKEGISRGEKKRLLGLYEELGGQLSNSSEYRKEILVKLLHITSKEKNRSDYDDCRIQLGGVLFYCNLENNPVKSRKAIFEAIYLLTPESKRRTLNAIDGVLCEALVSYGSIRAIVDEKEELLKALQCMSVKSDRSVGLSKFCKSMKKSVDNIVRASECSDISQKVRHYQQISIQFRDQFSKSENYNTRNQIYRRWYGYTQEEIKRLSKGAVINLEVETKQCAGRGKICCVLQNLGDKPARNIVIKVIVDADVRCRDNEKEIPILYGNDTEVFAFTIRSKKEGEHKIKIEVSYENAKGKEQMELENIIRIIEKTEYDHIGNIYSVAPVTSNDEFYGRELEKKNLESFLKDVTNNTSIVMHGLKRVGKTSMLRYLERTMKNSEWYIPVYKSAQGIGEEIPVGRMFVKSIIDELENMGVVDDKCRSYLEYNYDKNPELLYEFYTYLQKSGILGEKRILFMADEIEEIFDMVDEGIINKKFYKVLRVILQELTVIRFIFCGADYLTNILFNYSLSDIFEITKRITISRLDESSMAKMITEPAKDKITYTRHAVDRIWYYTKGHTFYSKHICGYVIDILNEESRAIVYAYDIDCAIKQVMRITEYFIYLSRFFSENDKEVIRILCDNLRFAGDNVSLDKLEDNYESEELISILKGLEFKDILVRIEGRDDEYYQFAIEMFRLWYSKAEYTVGSKEDIADE